MQRRQRRRDRREEAKEAVSVAAYDLPVRRPQRSAQPIIPLNEAQERYLKAINSHDVTFGIGPSGTGKTFIAAGIACDLLVGKKVERIIITRPALEAGEKLGFMPGELEEKFDPYFAPVRMIMEKRLGASYVEYAIKAGKIIAQPLAFMRGHTFEDAFVLLDEAQNTTPAQMKLFMTRLGEPVKCVIDGDLRQSDLPHGMPSGLEDAIYRFTGSPGFARVDFTRDDIVRSGLCRIIVEGYDGI